MSTRAKVTHTIVTTRKGFQIRIAADCNAARHAVRLSDLGAWANRAPRDPVYRANGERDNRLILI
jgi:hypothetical protein